MVEFVHEKGSSTSKDEESKRRVRSQAMRDFRRRQREEREAARITREQLSVPSDGRNVSPLASQRSQSEHREPSATSGSRTTLNSGRTRSFPTGSFSPPDRIDHTFNTLKLQTTQAGLVPNDVESLQDLGEWNFEDFSFDIHTGDLSPYWQVDAPSFAPTPTARSEPSASPAGGGDTFESPVQIEQMISFCHSYLCWLCPGVETATARRLLGNAWGQNPSPMMLAAFCLASAGHLDAVQPGRPSGNYQAYKTRLLQHISTQMEDRETATSEETIGILACLLSFEISKCTEEPVRHLRGLKALSSQRRDVPIMVKTLDLIHAVLFDRSTILLDSTLASASASQMEQILLTELQSLEQSQHSHNIQPSQGLARLLKESSMCMHNLERGINDTSALLSFQNTLNTFGRNAFNSFGSFPNTIHFHKCCHSAFCILFNSLTTRIPLRHAGNQPYADGVYEAFMETPSSSWQNLPYLRLYILLIAGAATLRDHIKSYVNAEMARGIYQMSENEWRRIEMFILRFLARRRIFGGF